MKFLRKKQGCTGLDKHRNKDIRRDLQIFYLNNRILEYKYKLFQHVKRKDNDKLSEKATAYKPNGKRSQGHPLTRWEDF
jgi:purine nucleoside permease